ncbi:DM13 domain-containing protein [Echinicola sp. 20G]|uniref:DM13 domain-containing protein n=1 Tax=Echinicola sp. 20G TaxID=2781961 RepID=UPI001F2FB70E|nr:DM13 domain-containing protein [Echinicola sp. 20G]
MMKTSLVILLVIFFGVACNSDGTEPQSPSMTMDPSDSSGGNEGDVLYQGDFKSDAHPTSGVATVNQSKSQLSFTNFKTDPGPLLEVYLATDQNATNYVSLGELKGIEGDFSYAIPNNVNLTTHNYVLIWCVDFSVNFGYAILE